jgi:hypothetical protein
MFFSNATAFTGDVSGDVSGWGVRNVPLTLRM